MIEYWITHRGQIIPITPLIMYREIALYRTPADLYALVHLPSSIHLPLLSHHRASFLSCHQWFKQWWMLVTPETFARDAGGGWHVDSAFARMYRALLRQEVGLLCVSLACAPPV